MVTLYIKNKLDNIQKVIFDYDLIYIELNQYNINIEKYLELSNQDLESIAKRNEYVYWDYFKSDPIIMEAHYHKGPEHRIILNGSVTFSLYVNDLIYELNLDAGYGINVPDRQIHWFKSIEPFQAVRFFTNLDGHVKYSVPEDFLNI